MTSKRRTSLRQNQFSFVYPLAAAAIVGVAVAAIYFRMNPPESLWCLPFEKQDWELGYCYAACSDAQSCTALDDQYKMVQETFSNEDRVWYYDFSSMPLEVPEGGFAPSSASSYTINKIVDGKLGELIDASSTTRYQGYNERTWDLISPVLPKVASKRIVEFAGFADVAGDAGAFVMPADETSRNWSVNVNYAYFYTPRNTLYDRGSTIHTLLHEIGHVITLGDAFEPNTYTMDFEGNSIEKTWDCYTTQFIEGCAKPGSYVAIFAARFWPEAKGDGEVSAEYAPEKFVSSYAATTIAEDIAETWTAFVLLDKPKGTALVDQKVLFFYSYPEFVQARQEILKNIHRAH